MLRKHPRKNFEWETKTITNDDGNVAKWVMNICKSICELGPGSIESIQVLDDRTCKIWYADPKYDPPIKGVDDTD